MIELSENIANYIQSVFGDDFLSKYKAYVATEYIQYVRIPGSSDEQKGIVNRLLYYGVELSNVENVPNAYSVIKGNDKVGKTLEHALGKYYIQAYSRRYSN